MVINSISIRYPSFSLSTIFMFAWVLWATLISKGPFLGTNLGTKKVRFNIRIDRFLTGMIRYPK